MGTNDLTKKSFLNSAASILQFLARIGTQLVVTPILVLTLGEGLFGAWQICLRLLDQLVSTEGRSLQALKWTLAHKLSDPDPLPKRTDVGSAVRVWTIFLPLQIAVGAAIVCLAPVFVGESADELGSTVRLALLILVLNLLLSGLTNLGDAILVGENLGYKALKLRIPMVVFNGALLVTAAKLGFGIPGLACAVVVVTITTGLGYLVLVRLNVRWLGIAWPNREQLKSFFGFSAWVMLWTLFNKLLLSGDVIVLGIVASAEVVTTYFLTLYLMQAGASIISMAVGGAMPSLGKIVGQGHWEAARAVRSEIMRLTWLLVTVLGGVAILWNERFLGIWVGPDKFAGGIANLLIVALIAQQVFFRNDAFMIDTTLNIRKKVAFGAIGAVSTLAAAALLGRAFGIVGLLCGLILGRMVLTLALPILVSTNLKGRPLRQFLGVVRPGLTTAAIFYACWSFQPLLQAESWISLILFAGATSVATLGAALLVGLSAAHRKQLVQRLTAMLPRGAG